MSGILQLVLSLSLGGSLLALLVLGMRLLLGRRLPSIFYYYAWLLVLLRLVLPLPGFLGPGRESVVPPAPAPTVPYNPAPSQNGSARTVRSGELPMASGVMDDGGVPEYSLPEENPSSAPEVSYTPAVQRRPMLPSLAALGEELFDLIGPLLGSAAFWLRLWAAGAAGSLAWYLGSYLVFSRSLRRSLRRASLFERRQFSQAGAPRRLKLCRSEAVSTPILLGLLHPVLVLPQRDYSPQMLNNIFLHELTHYRRGDLIFKWFAVFVSAFHWFNPIVHIVRRELDRACEMSCDEKLLRHMDNSGKRSYGETLLSLAATGSISRRLVATSFATEKRNLKERLEQIMKYKPMSRAGLALLLTATLLLCGCAGALGPGGEQEAQSSSPPAESAAPVESAAPSPSPIPTPEPRDVTVSTVDELLSAIGPNTTITLTEGVYDLSQASDYGVAQSGGYYSWADCFDGSELVISGLSGLSLIGEGDVTISAIPRYADVLSFSGCKDICLSGLTVGHTEAEGECAGGVVDLVAVDGIIISQSKLFGCGVVGVRGNDSTGIQVVESEIYDCSYSAVDLRNCLDAVFNNCRIYDNYTYTSIFSFSTSENCAVMNCEISGNSGRCLLDANYCPNTYFAGNIVENNSLMGGVFYMGGTPAVVEGCSFSGNSGPWYTEAYLYSQEQSQKVTDAQGNPLSDSQLQSMEHFTAEGWEPTVVDSSKLPVSEDGYIHVSTVDEFLAAIGPNTAIYLEDGEYDLSSAANYGGYGSQYYLWKDTNVDGPQLVLCNLRGLSITGGGADKVSITAQPRYAEVLAFDNCQDISLAGFTAGHNQEPGNCVGGVLYFNETGNISVEDCSLYGCGVWGITAYDCTGLQVKGTEIYECSNGDLNLNQCKDVNFEDCNFHHNGFSRVVNQCLNASMDGEPLLSYSPPSARALKAENIEPGSLKLNNLYIYYSGAVTQLTLPDSVPIRISAQILGDKGPETVEDVKWSASDESKLSLEPGNHGVCVVENLGNNSGSVTVTAEYEGQTAQVKINFVKELPELSSPLYGSPSAASAAVVTPTPAAAAEDLHIMYSNEERTELTLNVGDEPVELTAQVLPPSFTGAKVTWSIEGDDKGEYCAVKSTGDTSCEVSALKAKSGGVTLVAECGGLSKTCSVYLLPSSK